MNREQKQSWLTVAMFLISLAGFLILWPMVGLARAPIAFAAVGLAGLGPLIFRRPRGQAVEFDERDRAIHRRSALAGGMVSYGVFLLACMGVWGYLHHTDTQTVRIDILPHIVWAGAVALFVTRSVAMLAMYRWGKVHAEE